DAELPAHAQVTHQGQVAAGQARAERVLVEVQPHELPAPAAAGDRQSAQRRGEILDARRMAAHRPGVVDLDGADASAAEGRIDPAADRLYFGKLRHRSSMTGAST